MTTFPVLSRYELVKAFAEEYPELKMRDDDFTNPQRERWQHLYVTLLSLLTDTPLDLLNSNLFRAIKDVEHLEVHSEGLSLCLLAKAMQKKLEKAALPNNFTVRDIIQPTEKRVCTIMSCILNYLRYKLQCENDFLEAKSKTQEREAHYEALKKENDELVSRINAIRAAQAQQEPKIAKAREEYDAKKKHFAELQVQASALQATGSQMKTKASELTSAMANCSEEIASKKQEIDRLDCMIVHSPERAALDRAVMEEKLEQMKATKKDKLWRLGEMKAARLLHRSFEGKQACELLKGIQKVEEREREAVMQMKSLQNENQQRHAEFVNLDRQKQSLQRTVISRQEKQDKMTLQHRVKEDSINSQLNELQKTVEKLDVKDDRVRVLEEARREIQQKVDAQRQEFADRHESLRSDHEMLQKVFEGYKKMLQDGFDEAFSNFTLPDLDS